jgi:hypothetical protein
MVFRVLFQEKAKLLEPDATMHDVSCGEKYTTTM